MDDMLRKFVKNYMDATNNNGNLEEIIKLIKEKAREQAVDGCASLSESEVEKIIDQSQELLANQKKEEVQEEEEEEEEEIATPTPTPKKQIEKSKSESEFDFSQLKLL